MVNNFGMDKAISPIKDLDRDFANENLKAKCR